MLLHYFFLLHSCNIFFELHVFVMVWFFYSSLEKSSIFGLDFLLQLLLALLIVSFVFRMEDIHHHVLISLLKYVHKQLKKVGVLEFQISKKALFSKCK